MSDRSAYATRVSLVVALGGFLMGFDSAVISGVVDPVQVSVGTVVADQCRIDRRKTGQIADVFMCEITECLVSCGIATGGERQCGQKQRDKKTVH